jgi:hypothetical protein
MRTYRDRYFGVTEELKSQIMRARFFPATKMADYFPLLQGLLLSLAML